MGNSYIWFALLVSVVATVSIRLTAVGMARSKIFAQLNEETLSRVFPLVILFILVFKELITSLDLSVQDGLLKILGVLIVAALHLWKKSLFLSVMGGTAIYVLMLYLF